eukprot:270189_1
MPSFSCSKAHQNYGYYFEHSDDVLTSATIFMFIKLFISIVFYIFSIIYLYTYLFNYLYFHHPVWYSNHNIGNIYSIITIGLIIIFPISIICIFMKICDCIKHQKRFISSCFVISYLLFLPCILSRDTLLNSNLFDNSHAICNVLWCSDHFYNWYYINIYIILPFVSPIFTTAILLIIYKHASKSNNIYQTDLTSLNNYVSLNDSSNIIAKQTSLTQITLLCSMLYLVFFVSIASLYFWTGLKPHFINNYFDYVFWAFLVYQWMLKKILKRLATLIEYHRQINGTDDNYISLEYLTEFYCSVYYYLFTKYYVGFNHTSIEHLWFLFILHFLTEIIETNILFTEFYFNITKQISQIFETNQRSVCYKTLNNLFGNECVLCEWRARLSMDIFARLFGSFLVSIFVLGFFIVADKKGFELDYGENLYYYAIKYSIIYTIQDILYYLTTIIIIHCYFRFNMIGQFTSHINKFNRLHLCYNLMIYASFMTLILYNV